MEQNPPGHAALAVVIPMYAACKPLCPTEARLSNLSVRFLFHKQVPHLVPMLQAASAATGDLFLMVERPEALPLPPGSPPAAMAQWQGILRPLSAGVRRVREEITALIPAIGGIEAIPAVAELPEPENAALHALWEESAAIFGAAAQAKDPQMLLPELALWHHAAGHGLRYLTGDAALLLAQQLIELLPDRRETLIAGWAAVLSDAQRQSLIDFQIH